MDRQIIIAGLGNPGRQYEHTRHNVGFEALEKLAALLSQAGVSWRLDKDSETTNISFEGASLLLVKPLLYMNLSGDPLQRLSHYYKIPLERLIVLHDELDLPFGTVRQKRGGGEAGHNGLKSITEKFSSQDYYRVRIGIGRPPNAEIDAASWVLAKFTKDEAKVLPEIVQRASEAAVKTIREIASHNL
jgi:PTH1 family peptidyl-tRNA hydrolase